MRGHTAIGAGQGSGLTNRALGTALGEENHTLTVAEMPSHSHSTAGPGFDANLSGNGGSYQPLPASTGSTGGNGAHNTMQPSLTLNYIIKI